MRLLVMVAMMGCRLELGLIVLKLYFLSSCPVGKVGEVWEELDMPDVRREWTGFGTQRAFTFRPCSSAVLNSRPPFCIFVTSQRLTPSSMQISVTSLSLFAGQMTPMTSLAPQFSSSDFLCSLLLA